MLYHEVRASPETTFSITFQVKDSSSPVQAATSALELTVNGSSSTNYPTGQPCGATAPYCVAYTPPSTSGATDILTLPVGYGGTFLIANPGNYYHSADVSNAKSGIAVLTTSGSVDINLNGHTLAYGTTADGSGSSQIGEYGILQHSQGRGGTRGFELWKQRPVFEWRHVGEQCDHREWHDHTISKCVPANCPGSGVNSGSSGACAKPHDAIASHAIYSAYNSGLSVKHVTINIQNVDSRGIAYQWQQSGNGMDIECNTINDKFTRLNARAEAHAAVWSGNQLSVNEGSARLRRIHVFL